LIYGFNFFRLEALKIMIKKITLAFLTGGIIFALYSCAPSVPYFETKMDVKLKQKIAFLERDNSTEIISIIGKADKSISEEMKEQMIEQNVKVESVINNLFTASGNYKAIKNLAGLGFINYISLSINRNIN